MGNLPINGNLPIEAKGIPNIGWRNSQYRLQDLPVVGIATVFPLALIVCTYNHITVCTSASLAQSFYKYLDRRYLHITPLLLHSWKPSPFSQQQRSSVLKVNLVSPWTFWWIIMLYGTRFDRWPRILYDMYNIWQSLGYIYPYT